MPLGVAWGVSRWARSAIGIRDERVSVHVSDSRFSTSLRKMLANLRFNMNLQRICLPIPISIGT